MTPWKFVVMYDSMLMVEMFRVIVTDIFDTWSGDLFLGIPEVVTLDNGTLRCVRGLRDRACEHAKGTKTDSACRYCRDMRNMYNAAVLKDKYVYFNTYVTKNFQQPSLF